MLDGKNLIVANKTERAYKISPIFLAVTVANCTEYPGSVYFITVVLSIKNAVYSCVDIVDSCILCV